MSVITDCPYICAPNIMDTPDYTTKTVTLDMTDQTVIKAGTPISADGKVANDETAIGVLLNDCHACLGARRGLVVISGRVKQDVAADHSGVTISDEAKSAMINLTFTGDGARGGGGEIPTKTSQLENDSGFLTEHQSLDAKADKADPVFTGVFSQNRKSNTTIGDFSHAEGRYTTASGDYSHAEGNEAVASNDGSHAEGYRTTASGRYSHAEGEESKAEGKWSHVEGYVSVASGIQSHAEGGSTASGDYSHAEGRQTTASGSCSHTEGRNTTAGDYSHAEGWTSSATGANGSHAEGFATKASGVVAHSEGWLTEATGSYSHAEGYYTKAAGEYQHVQGQYNAVESGNLSTLAHIVGNGTSDTARSNAHTLDWSGNAWFAGTMEGTALILKSATEGSTKKFKITVDDSGTLSATEVTE